MDVLRERECKDSMERQLSDERKLRGKFTLTFSFFSIVNNRNQQKKKENFFHPIRLCISIRLISISWGFSL